MTKQQKYGILLAYLTKSTVYHEDRLRDQTVKFIYNNFNKLAEKNFPDIFELQKELLYLELEMKTWGIDYPLKTLDDARYINDLIRSKEQAILRD